MTNGRGGLAFSTDDPSCAPLADKPAARAAAKLRRATAHAARAADAPGRIARALTDLLRQRFAAPGRIAGYVAIRDELDALPALAAAAALGWVCSLPAVIAPAAPLRFRPWHPGDPLTPGAFRVPEPAAEAGEIRPDVVLVPMLAFDERGHRMGYGAGFYDRTLAALRRDGPVLAVGIAYAGQRQERLPTDAHDQPLDLILTEAGQAFPAPTTGRARNTD